MYKNLSEKEIDDQIYDDINIDKLLSICEKQKSLKEENDQIKRKEVRKEKLNKYQKIKKIERYTILIDDLLDSPLFTSFFSKLSGLCTKNRHWNIQFIYSGQHWGKISPLI